MEAARDVFVVDPTAPVSAVARRAREDMGAIYHRYETKEDLLRVLCGQGQNIWVAEVERALASEEAPSTPALERSGCPAQTGPSMT